MKEEAPTSYKVDAEGKIVLDHSEAGVSPESMQNPSGPDGSVGGSSEDTDAWYKQNSNRGRVVFTLIPLTESIHNDTKMN